MKSVPVVIIGFLLSSYLSISHAEPDPSSIQRVYDGVGKSEVWQSVMASLKKQDLPVVASDFERGKIRARQHNYLNAAWASCPNSYTRFFDPAHPTNLNLRSSPLYRGVDLKLEIAETAGDTTLSLKPSYTNAVSDTRRRTFAFQVSCKSTGILEQTLFAAAGDRP